MNTEIKIIDILVYSNLLIVPLSLLLILVKNKLSNYFFATQFVFYQISIFFIPLIYFLISLKIINQTTFYLYIIGTLFIGSNYIFYYLINKSILHKKTKFDLIDFAHIIPIIFVVFYIANQYFESFEIKSGNILVGMIELQKMIFFRNTSNILLAIRVIYATFYLFLATGLLVKILKTTFIINYSKQTKTFLLMLFISKIGNFIAFILGIIAILYNSQIIIELVKLLFLVFSLITPIYLIVEPKIISVITNFIVDTKKKENSQCDKKEVISILNNLISSNKLFLNTNYSIVNLSADSNISIIKIRETIKESGCNNYSEFINTFKINFAIDLINEGYLDRFSIESLSKESGFQSEVTFYRIFKKINGCTPKEYKNKEDYNMVYE